MASIVERLTENIVERNLLREGAALSKKWEKTGLLEGIDNSMTKTTMSRLLENQAKELLREASTMSAGDVEGFAAVAFPIVRRVFGGLIANELVAVQPMSLPSGLIFFLDFNYNAASNLGINSNTGSVYGGGVLASQITGGVVLTGVDAERGFYALNNGYSSPTGSTGDLDSDTSVATTKFTISSAYTLSTMTAAELTSVLGDDVDEVNSTDSPQYRVITVLGSDLSLTETVNGTTVTGQADFNNLVAFNLAAGSSSSVLASGATLVRRLTKKTGTGGANVAFVIRKGGGDPATGTSSKKVKVVFPVKDGFANATGKLGAVLEALFDEGAGTSTSGFNTSTGLTNQNTVIPEIDIKVDSIAVTAQTKKLKAKWSPELGQDLNAYHNLDAEVELTSILSEHVALEIDQEILNDLVKGATAGVKYWSRRPGKFVNRDTGASITSVGAPPDFTGNVSMWYETLVETINDLSAQIHRKTLRGGANFLVTSPEVANLLEFTSGFRADISMEELKGGSVGAVKAGSISKKWDVYVDPYFPRNLILVGRRGKAFLESGYVYAPYVPLMITPTIFGTEDFVPRKGLMTRYAKKMVRPDMFGLVYVQDLIG